MNPLTRFLQTLHPTEDGWCELRALPSKAQTFAPVGDVAAVTAFLAGHLHEDVYIGIATRRTTTNGTLENCAELWAVFLDIDFKTVPEADARARLAHFPLPPTMVVNSGGGLHAYFALKEPLDLPGEASLATTTLRRLAATLGGDVASAEPARILRLPGSFNHKPEYPEVRPVQLVDDDVVHRGEQSARRYNLSELEALLPADTVPASNGRGHTPVTVPAVIRDGARNDTLYRLARSLHAKGWSAEAMQAALAAENLARCTPPLARDEVATIATNATTQADRPDFNTETSATDVDLHAAFEESADALIARLLTTPATPMLIESFMPGEGITLLHGQPRGLKTWCAQECAVALASGTRAFGALAVPTAVPVLYVTNEDAWRLVGRRLDALQRGRGLTALPLFATAIQTNLWLEDVAWQRRLVARVQDVGYRVVILDPLRSVSGCVDQGPHELQPLARFLRRLIDETGVLPLLAHHDTKPLQGQRDTRARPQRAAGGGIFSIADAPIHCERMGDGTPATTLLVPQLWKPCDTPPPLRVQLTVDADGARLTGTPMAASDVRDAAVDEAILTALREHTELSTRQVATLVGARRDTVTARLEALVGGADLDSRPGPRQATLWFLRRRNT